MVSKATEHYRQPPGPALEGRRPQHTLAGMLHGVAQLVLLGMLAVSPWLLGGVYGTTQVWLFAAAIVALACWLGQRVLNRTQPAVLPLAAIPLIGALLLGLVQVLPAGSGVTGWLSPGAAQLRSELAAPSSPAESSLAESLELAPLPQQGPLSLFPASTRRDLALMLLGVIVFFLGANLFQSPRAGVWLCGLLAVNGAVISLFGLAQRLTFNGLVLWNIPMLQRGSPFGPFVNQNNAGGLLCLCLAGALGLTVYVVERHRLADRCAVATGAQVLPLGEQAKQRIAELLANLDGPTLFAAGLTALIVAGIFCSLSRGAALGMVGATIATVLALLATRRRQARVWLVALVATMGLGLISWAGLSEPVYNRVATLFDSEAIAGHSLLPHWRTAVQVVPDFWPAGSGVGTYRYIYSLHQQEPQESWFYHAENQYIESLVEGGVLGLVLLLLALAMLAVAAWRLLRAPNQPATLAFAIAGVFALTAQVIAGAFDFGLHIPSNLITFALLAGAVAGRAALLPAAQPATCRMSALCRWATTAFAPVTAGVVLLLVGIGGLVELHRAAAVETVLHQTRYDDTPADVLEDELLGAMDRLDAALLQRPDDAEGQYGMARLWTRLYQVRAFHQLRAAATEPIDEDTLWAATSPVTLHQRAHQLAREKLQAELAELRNEPIIRDHVTESARHLLLARQACPVLPEVHVALAELAPIGEDLTSDQVHVQRAQRLAPADPNLLDRCALLEYQAGQFEAACATWRKSLSLSLDHLPAVLVVIDDQISAPGMIEKLLPPNPELLVKLAQNEYSAAEHAELRRQLIERAASLLDADPAIPDDERYHVRGAIAVLQGAYPAAIESYTRAVELRPRDVAWRIELARVLQQQGQLDAAYEHAKACARIAPRRDDCRKLLQQIHDQRLR